MHVSSNIGTFEWGSIHLKLLFSKLLFKDAKDREFFPGLRKSNAQYQKEGQVALFWLIGIISALVVAIMIVIFLIISNLFEIPRYFYPVRSSFDFFFVKRTQACTFVFGLA